MNVLIIANGKLSNPGEYKDIVLQSHFIIACDGGYSHIRSLGITTLDAAIGDFDSHFEKDIRAEKVISFPKEKDKTDIELALEYAINKEATAITILGGLGDRLDHSINLLYTISRFKEPAIKIIDEYNEVFVIQKNRNIIEGNIGQKISFIPMHIPIKHVESEGLHYPLYTDWFNKGTLSISNEFIQKEAIVTLEDAKFIVIKVLKNR